MYGRYLDPDEFEQYERRKLADERASLAVGSPDSWIEQQANRNPAWMRRQPDMSFTLEEAETAPDMRFELDEADPPVDMRFSLDEAERPDMEFSLEETEPGLSPQRSAPIAAASASQSALQPRMSSLLQKPGGLDERWLTAENTALDRSGLTGDESYGFGEAIRDFAPMAIGGTLDVLLNKGRGLGALTAGGMQALSSERSRRDANKKQAADQALAIRRQREAGGDPELERTYKLAQMERWAKQGELGEGNLEQRGIQTMISQAKLAYEQDPNNPQALALVAKVKDITGIDLTGLGNQAQGRVMGVVGRQQGAQLAGPMADARNRSDLGYAAPIAKQKEIGSAEGALAAAPTTAAANAAVGKVPERAVRDEAFATQFAKDNEASIKIALALNAIEGKAQGGQPAPGLDPVTRIGSRIPGATQMFPERFTQDVQTVLQNLDLAEEAYSRDQSGAAIGVKEAAKFLRQVIGSPMASAQDVQAAITRFNERNNEYLRGRAAANPQAAQSVLSASGLNLGARPQQPAAAGPVRLGGGRSQAQATPVGGQASGGMVNAPGGGRVLMVDPEGEQGEVSEAEAAELERQGYRRVR
jgi:hypothetical protein